MRRSPKRALVFLAGALWILVPPPAGAFERDQIESGFQIGIGGGKAVDSHRPTRGVYLADVRLGRYGRPVEAGLLSGNPGWIVEAVPLISIGQEPRALGGGISLLFRYVLRGRVVRPFLELGLGCLWTDTDVPPGDSDFNFTPQGGIGVKHLWSPRWGVDAEARFHHISNNGMTERNLGFNSVVILLGLSYFPANR